MNTRVRLGVAVVCLQLACGAAVQAQGVVEAIGSSGSERFYDATATSDGGLVAVGSTTSFGGTRMLVVKVDACGDVEWSRVVGETGCTSIAHFVFASSTGHLVVGGETTGLAGSAKGLALVKLTAAGGYVWSKVLLDAGEDLEFTGYDGIEDSDGDYVITGFMRRNIINQDTLLIVGFDADGSVLIVRSYYGTLTPRCDHYGYGLIERDNGHYLVAGKIVDATGDSFALMFGTNHNLLQPWARWIGDDDENAVAYDVAETSDDGAVLTGVAAGHLFVSRRDDELDRVWQKWLNATSDGRSIIQADDGDFIVTGQVGSNAVLTLFDDAGYCVRTSMMSSGAEFGYALVEGLDDTGAHPLWLAGDTTSWGLGARDGLLAKFTADMETCVAQFWASGCSDWTTPEDVHYVGGWTPGDYVLWTWSTPADPNLTQTIVCASDRCDVNGDGYVNNFDISPFVYAVTHTEAQFRAYYDCPPYDYWAADINCDTEVNNFDISLFADCLAQ